MAVISELIRSQADGSISFGDYSLDTKSKLDNFEHGGDLYKVKTFKEITKLEKNGMFVYESVPGTVVTGMKMTETGAEFQVEGIEDAEITLGLQDATDYEIVIGDVNAGQMKTNLGGKLTLSVEMNASNPVNVKVVKL